MWTTVETLEEADLKPELFRAAKKDLGSCFDRGTEMLRRLSGFDQFVLIPAVFVRLEAIRRLRPERHPFYVKPEEDARDPFRGSNVRKLEPILIDLLGLCLRKETIQRKLKDKDPTMLAIQKECPTCLTGDFLILLDFQGIKETAVGLLQFLREGKGVHDSYPFLGSNEVRVAKNAYSNANDENAVRVLLQKVFLHEQGHACSLSPNYYRTIERRDPDTVALAQESIANYLAYMAMNRLLELDVWKRFLQIFIFRQPTEYYYCHSWVLAHQHGFERRLAEIITNLREQPATLDWNWLRERILRWELE